MNRFLSVIIAISTFFPSYVIAKPADHTMHSEILSENTFILRGDEAIEAKFGTSCSTSVGAIIVNSIEIFGLNIINLTIYSKNKGRRFRT